MIDADDERLEAMERRGRLVGLVIVELIVGLLVAGLVLVLLHTGSVLYGSASVVRRYGLVGVLVVAGLFVVLARRFGYPRALILGGGLVLVAAAALGVMPREGGVGGGCRSVLGDYWGSHGDENETCYDARRVQVIDMASTAGVGLVLVGAGLALSARELPS